MPNCPTSYWRTKARDPKVRVAQRAVLNLNEEELSLEPPASEIPPAASTDTQLDYAFYSLRKGVQARITDPKLECIKACVWGNQESMEFSLRVQYLTLAIYNITIKRVYYHSTDSLSIYYHFTDTILSCYHCTDS